ncbi:chemotaxis protein CheB [Rhizobium cauense]|uniref:chemotaxis protein CheB n=1 Tax=Rhizobium cauense TaxID=1166683 RepID=UPI001C6DDA90|nr:chemotaxis protein CheB [Rhizobium cauense]MBW9117372.1 chemotaxis protein CheB [Rhizobium cauense]
MTNRDIVVIGGSAGSIKPLTSVLGRLPTDLKAAVIVVIHVPSGSLGVYSAVASGCPLPVIMAQDGMPIERSRVYIAPPNHHLLLLDGHFKLGNGPRENLARPAIDPMFRSAALTAGSRVIGLILSGMLNDGASGLATIKRCGGIALVQAPNIAASPAMPIAALEATPVDLSGAEEDIALAITRLVGEEAGPPVATPPELRLEVEIAAGAASTVDTIEKLGHPIALTCPDCGGVMSEIDEARPLRFRCQVGHAYTGKALLSQQQDVVDEAMRVALRIIEERAELVSRMARDADVSGRNGMAETYAQRADEYRAQAEVLRQALVQLMELKSQGLNETDIAAHEARAELEQSVSDVHPCNPPFCPHPSRP